ncbi:MAG: hypothetical protein MUE30_01390 [Spirosomaceae bacterium]|nr:hypothetical protein [Spirosomataceae bacterium]
MKQRLNAVVWMGAMAVVLGCEERIVEKTSSTEATTAGAVICDPTRPIATAEETNSERGFFNPKDSLVYSTLVYEIFYRGGTTNPCELIRRPKEYKDLMSRKLRVVWSGPKGETVDRKIPRAMIRFTDKAYRDDVDTHLPKPDTLRPFPFEIKVKEDSSYVTIPTNREYKVALQKGYSNVLNEVKCAEVSLSATPAFDPQRVILENAASSSWSQRYFFKATDFAPNVQYIVVREKECATCDVPVPTLSALSTTISLGESAEVLLNGCPTSQFGQGPLEWFEQPRGEEKRLLQRYSYSATGTRLLKPTKTTTYFLRCQGDWHCKPQREVSITIEVR